MSADGDAVRKKIAGFMRRTWWREQRWPSVREIATAVGRNTATTTVHLRVMAEAGVTMKRDDGRNGGQWVLVSREKCPGCGADLY